MPEDGNGGLGVVFDAQPRASFVGAFGAGGAVGSDGVGASVVCLGHQSTAGVARVLVAGALFF
jgi:hypothetical protein